MRALSGLERWPEGFLASRDGNFAVITAVLASTLAMTVGLAVNVGQAFHIKSSLRNALDAAVTSTARDITTGKIRLEDAPAIVDRFLQANSNSEFATNQKFKLTSVQVDRVTRTVEASAEARVDLAFDIFTTKQPLVSETAAALYSDRTIEVAMMLDVTGSMQKTGTTDKIGDLRAAAKNAVNLMLDGQDPKNPRIRVAIVPYAEAVNTGKLAAGSVFFEVAGGANLPPLLSEAVPVALPKRSDNCATERKNADGTADFSDDGPGDIRPRKAGAKTEEYYALVNRDDRVDVCPKAELVPLTADKAKLTDSIDDFRASGVTAGGIAAQWGYYMLSPQWRGAIKSAGLGDGPANYDPKKIAKVAILMTDGQFNTAFADVSGTPQMQQGSKSRAYAENICANMKSDGIEVFTIGFDLDNRNMTATERNQAKTVLKNCASKDTGVVKHYYEASTGAELDAAFSDIIKNTERLALTR